MGGKGGEKEGPDDAELRREEKVLLARVEALGGGDKVSRDGDGSDGRNQALQGCRGPRTRF